MAGRPVDWFRRHDPEFYALHKAIKVAVAVSAGVAIGTVSGNGQVTLFAGFGSVAFLLFADFPGDRSARFGAYVGLYAVGALLICLGTLSSNIPWLAVTGMGVFGFLILFSGLLSAAVAAGSRAALLSFILPVTVPGTAADMVFRLAGWSVSAAIAIPLAVLVWPPADHHKLRRRGADACAALAEQLTARTTGDAAQTQKADEAASDGIVALRNQFRSTTFRPVGLTSGSRVLMQLTDRLEWLYAVARRVPITAGARWPSHTLELVTSCADVLRAASDVLASGARPTYESRQALSLALREVERHRARVCVFLEVVAEGTGTDAPATPQDDSVLRPAVAHELAYTSLLAGSTVAVSAAADARPLLDRLLGRRLPGTLEGPVAAAHRIAAGHVTRRSVWFQNSLRGAAGLAFAVLLAEITQIQHGFWVVLGAMSVLRTTALTTGSTALRALLGTLVGFLTGAVIILAVGTTQSHLWVVLPVSVLIAAYLPEAVSFAAGQAAFTVMVVVLFNIINPVGWSVGLLRIEDIALGCLAGVVSGILLWPRGAAAQIRAAMSDHYRCSADLLSAAAQRLTDTGRVDADVLRQAVAEARSASLRLDDAFRQYLFERGTKTVPVSELTALSNGAVRVRLAAEAIAAMKDPLGGTQFFLPDHDSDGTAGDPGTAHLASGSPAATALTAIASEVVECATHCADWYCSLADLISRVTAALPPVGEAAAEQRLLATMHAHAALLDDPAVAARARTIWAASLYIDDLTRLETRVRDTITAINAARAPGAGGTEPPGLDRAAPLRKRVGSTP